MYSEVTSFTPTGTNTTVVLSDSALIVEDVTFMVQKNSASQDSGSTGWSDATNNVSSWHVVTSSKREGNQNTSNALYYREDVSGTTTDKVIGGCTGTAFNTAGQFVFTASTWTGISILAIVRGRH